MLEISNSRLLLMMLDSFYTSLFAFFALLKIHPFISWFCVALSVFYFLLFFSELLYILELVPEDEVERGLYNE